MSRYDLISDPGEAHPLPYATDPRLQGIVAAITKARAAQMASVVPVVDQILRGFDPDYFLCGDPQSQERYRTASSPIIHLHAALQD